jgi:hypothetical protein
MVHVFARAALLCGVALGSGPRLPIPEFKIDLDKDPEERFNEVVQHFKEPLAAFLNHLHMSSPLVKVIAGLVAMKRGKENDELQREIEGIAKQAGFAAGEVHALQMFYELNSVMIPIVNFTGVPNIEEVADAMDRFQPHHLHHLQAHRASYPIHVGCTGIVAMDKEDGTVYHGRNLDFSFANYLQAIAYTGIFTKNGTEVFRAQTIAGYTAALTGMRKGPNGFSIEINTRFTDHWGGNGDMLRNLFKEKREISGWTKRKILETHDNYEDAVEAFSNTPYPASEYNIISGVKKGVVLARNPDGLAYKLPLSESTKDYVIMTNFDYPWHDVKEIFDPTTVKGIFHPRRAAAEKLLDAAPARTPELVFEVLNDDAVMAKDTIFQVIMNVEKGLWNASLPACVECGRGTELLV